MSIPQSTQNSYIPGMCNINHDEINQRRKLGYIGLIIFIFGLIALTVLTRDRWVRMLLLLPAILSVSGFLQARNKFCVGYAGSGLQNADEGSKKASKIIETDALAADKRKSSKMNRQTFAIALTATAITLLIP
jgi:hypothetical protein